MLIVYEGRSYPFEFDEIGVRQGIAIEKHTGMPFADWGAAVEKGGSLLALQALGWLIIGGGDLDTPIADCNFKMGKLGVALADAVQAEVDAAEALKAAQPGPTAAATSVLLPNGAGPATDGVLSDVSSGLT